MTHAKGTHHDLDQVFPPRRERRHLGPQWTDELPFDHPALAQRKDIDADLLLFQESRVRFGRSFVSLEEGQSRIGAGKEVVVNLPHALAVEVPGPEVVRGKQIHMALVAIGFRHRRIIEAPRSMAGNAREQVGVVMVLAPHEILVMIDGIRYSDLVTHRTKLGGLDDRLHELLLVHLRLGLDQRQVDPLEDRVVAEGERIMLRLGDRVGTIAPRVVNRGDHVADRAGDAGLACGVMFVVEIGVVELAGKERHGVVAAGAPARSLRRAVACHCHLPSLPHARQVRLVVERAASVRRVKPAFVGILVALEAVLVHHQGLGRE